MASPLDIFTIGFNSEGLKEFDQNLKQNEAELKRYEKEVEKLEKKFVDLSEAQGDNLEELYKTELEIKNAKAKVEELTSAIDTMKGKSEYQLLQMKKNFASLTKTIGMLAFVGVAIKKSLDFYEQGEQLDFLAEKTGIATERLQALANVSKRFGGTTEGTASTVETLIETRKSIKAGTASADQQKNASLFSDNPEKTLDNIARKMDTLKTESQKWDLAKSLGLDEATTRALIQGQEKYNESLKRADKYKLYSKEDLARMREYRQVSLDIRMGIDSIFGTIWRGLLPAILAVSKTMKRFTDFLAQHEGATKIVATFLAIASALGFVKLAVSVLNKETLKFLANPVVLTIVGIAAAITGIIVVIQDLITYIQGGESAFSGFWKKCEDGINFLKEKFQDFANFVSSIFGGFNKLAPVAIGQGTISAYNSNPLNSTPSGAISNYYQTQATNNQTKTISKNQASTSNKTTNIGEVKIEVKTTDPKTAGNSIQKALVGRDNGQTL